MKPIFRDVSESFQTVYRRLLCFQKNLNLVLERGQIIGLLGPNGSGKTTFIKLINDLITPTSGQILIDGKLPGVDTKAIVSYLPERTRYFSTQTMKIKDLIKYFADFYEDFRMERAFTMLRDLNIDQNARLKEPVKRKPKKKCSSFLS